MAFRTPTLSCAVCGLTVAGLLLVALPVDAAYYYALSTVDLPDIDPGDGLCDANASPSITTCTLRAAIMEANAAPNLDEVRLAIGETYLLTLAGSGEEAGDLDVTEAVKIVGNGSTIAMSAGLSYRIFTVSGGSLEIVDAILEDGDTSSSGGCINSVRDLTLRRVELRTCSAGGTGGAVSLGGGSSTLLIDRCWLHGNQATNGGGVYAAAGTVIVLDSAFSANAATFADGGAIRLSGGHLSVTNSTIAGNFAVREGGGIAVAGGFEISSSSIVANFCDTDADGEGSGCGIWDTASASEVRNSIIAENVNWNHFDPDDCWGSFDSGGYNLIGHPGADCDGFSAAYGDLLGAPTLDPRVEGFGDHGGPTPTMPPEPDSPVIDAANPAGCVGDLDGSSTTPATGLTFDQRGYPRTLDGDGSSGDRCDIGATEFAIFADGFESGDTAAWSDALT